MSLFQPVTLPCPACREEVPFDSVASVNADRRPDFRDQILSGIFQRSTCGKCKTTFRLDPEFAYLDVGRGQWIAVHPFGSIGDWEAVEARSRAAFERGYGRNAARAAREIGAGLKPRVTFGWDALREKIFAADQGLNDVDLELTKTAVLRVGGENIPLRAATELRLIDVEGDKLIMNWIIAETSQVVEKLTVPRDLYNEIATDKTDWQPLRQEMESQLFVDMQRLMMPVA
jgi:hypothetical protein